MGCSIKANTKMNTMNPYFVQKERSFLLTESHTWWFMHIDTIIQKPISNDIW